MIDKTRFCDNDKNHNDLINWMLSHDYILILDRPVWIVPHNFVGEKIAIRPHGLIFISEKVPKKFLKAIVFHEVVEEKYEISLGGKQAHEIAVIEEYNFLKKEGIQVKLLKWLRDLSEYAYINRIEIWSKNGFDINVICNISDD